MLKYLFTDSSGLSILIGTSKANLPSRTKYISSINSFSFINISFFFPEIGVKYLKVSAKKFVFEIPLKKSNFSIAFLYIEKMRLFLRE